MEKYFFLQVAEYWAKKYDWRKYEAVLNNFPQFTTQIEGLKVRTTFQRPNIMHRSHLCDTRVTGFKERR